ncbi:MULTISPECIES: hypothetical protein [Amycolatopsis]|uniref:Uncharacterized protein n=1 Tax=Amycolatopsis rubida TaxID=112413 RepID=A0A1I5SBK9_9PSEU|nr:MULTISPECIES: hypothetical protein [Amycolatopsis]OAP22832.1 hypothetical protein A4R44_06293 [Amycolatopsis sp. M39]SFP68072.1 hypothetical protein SAMN05421854_106264 [Amycolatopsis rubida]
MDRVPASAQTSTVHNGSAAARLRAELAALAESAALGAGTTGADDALLAAIQAAQHLADARSAPGPARPECLRAAQHCLRAASLATRFAIVAAADDCRLPR